MSSPDPLRHGMLQSRNLETELIGITPCLATALRYILSVGFPGTDCAAVGWLHIYEYRCAFI